MPTESGDRKVIDNYRQIIDHVTADLNYNPANPLIAKASLATHRTAAGAADDARPSGSPDTSGLLTRGLLTRALGRVSERRAVTPLPLGEVG
jgi:hypothetical protein